VKLIAFRWYHDAKKISVYGQLVGEGRKYAMLLVKNRRVRVFKQDIRPGFPIYAQRRKSRRNLDRPENAG
jgi:hypothetical protein